VQRINIAESGVPHELAVTDAKIAFSRTLANNPYYRLEEFSTWPAMYEFKAIPYGFDQRERTVKPDGFICIRGQGNYGRPTSHAFFLEVDRSTESHVVLVRKAAGYLHYYRSGGFAVWNGVQRQKFEDFPFRVLLVVENAERRNTVAEQMAHHSPPILSIVYLTTQAELEANPLGTIWVRPVDYLKAVAGSPYENPKPSRYGQARRSSRDLLVDERLKKTILLG
jgi:hypothetical protein